MTVVHAFDVEIVSAFDADERLITHSAKVSLAGVVLHTEDVTPTMRTGAPGREDEAKDEALYRFALRLRDLFPKEETDAHPE